MAQTLQSLKEEPARLLCHICREYEKTGKPVPDHHLHPSGYIGGVSLKALVAAGWLKLHAGERLSLFRYEPTGEGLQQYQNLLAEGFCSK